MRSIMRIVMRTILIGTLFCMGISAGEYIFSNNEYGYLFSMGYNGYVSNGKSQSSIDGISVLGITADPEKALPVKIIRKPFRGITYSVFAVSPTLCRRPLNRMEDAQCLFMYDRHLGRRTGLVLETEKGTFNEYFMVSVPLTRDTNAFQIYNQGKCVTVDHAGILDLEECIDASTKTKENQLFRWVDREWYQAGISARRAAKPYWKRK